MPQAPIPFGPSLRSGQERLGGAMPECMNVVVDRTGTMRRRPGIRAYIGAPSSVIDANGILAVHETESGVLYAVGGHPTQKAIYQVTGGGSVDVTTATAYKLQGTERPVIAETEAMLVMAAGNAPLKLLFSTNQTSALGGSPPNATHVIANSSRLLVNSTADRGLIYYSGLAAGSSIAGHETWSGITAGYFSAESRPDPIYAVHENTNSVYAFGRTTMQYFGPDGETVYAPVTTTENGSAAPYSVIKTDQAFAWLDHQRRFVVSDGRSLKVISDDIQQTIDDITTVSDCFGYRVHTGYAECLVWTFPSDGRTFAYQVGAGWAQWAGHTGAAWKQFPVTAHFLRAGADQNVVGLSSGRVAMLANGVADDLGEPIVASSTSGFLGRDTPLQKRCRAVRLTLRRGEASGTEPVGLLSWRDDLGAWSEGQVVSFGNNNDRSCVVELRSLGVYRQREWKWEFSGSVDYSVVSVVEDFEVLST